MIQLLCQRDIKWTNVKMTPSNLTLGRFGCLITSLCMVSEYFKCFTLPPQAIDTNIKLTKDGLVIWEKINFPTFKFEKRVRLFDPVAIADSLTDPRKAVVLNIWHGSHWVIALRGSIFGGFVIIDPWDGKKKTIKASEITGSAHFIAK